MGVRFDPQVLLGAPPVARPASLGPEGPRNALVRLLWEGGGQGHGLACRPDWVFLPAWWRAPSRRPVRVSA